MKNIQNWKMIMDSIQNKNLDHTKKNFITQQST